jgi:hypothetical protein
MIIIFRRRREVADGNLSPHKYARQMSAQRYFLNAGSRIDIDIDYFGAFNFL